MKSAILALALSILIMPLVADAAENAALACESGPVKRDFAASTWNIYACADDKSVVVVPLAAQDGEFGYFFVTPSDEGSIDAGEGWGDSGSFEPVLQQLKKMTASELAATVQAATSAEPAGELTK